jgi:small subunit ribosomal protein S16
VVVADARSPRDGRFIEIIGQYDPMSEPSTITIDNDKALAWLQKGAQPSEQVKSLLKRIGVWSEYVKDKGPAKKPPKSKRGVKHLQEAAAKAAAAQSEAPAAQAPAKPAAPAEAPAAPAPPEEAPQAEPTEA